MSEAWWIAIVSNGAVLIIALMALWGWSLKITWGISQVKEDIKLMIREHAADDLTEFAKVRQEIDDTARAFGETMAALRQGFNDFRLDAANTFVRREGFYKVHDQLNENIKAFREEIRADLRRVEQKIDTKT